MTVGAGPSPKVDAFGEAMASAHTRSHGLALLFLLGFVAVQGTADGRPREANRLAKPCALRHNDTIAPEASPRGNELTYFRPGLECPSARKSRRIAGRRQSTASYWGKPIGTWIVMWLVGSLTPGLFAAGQTCGLQRLAWRHGFGFGESSTHDVPASFPRLLARPPACQPAHPSSKHALSVEAALAGRRIA